MNNYNIYIQNSQKRHDAAVAQAIFSLCNNLCAFFKFLDQESTEQQTFEYLKTGRHLHDQEIGTMIKDCVTVSSTSFKQNTHTPHHVAH